MTRNGSNDGYPYPWGGNSKAPDLRHQESSISEVSSMHTASPPDLRHQVSSISGVTSLNTSSQQNLRSTPDFGFISTNSPPRDDRTLPVSLTATAPENRKAHIADEIDISRVRIVPSGSLGIGSTSQAPQGRSPKNLGRLSQMLPETLRVGSPTSPSTRSFNPFRSPTQEYEPVYAPDDYTKAKRAARSGSSRLANKRKSLSRLSMSHSAIPENEEIDMALLGSAMPMGLHKIKTSYTPLEEADIEHERVMSPVGLYDVSSFGGFPQTRDQLREVNAKEAAGILTGGLGAGLKPDATITSTDLYAHSLGIDL